MIENITAKDIKLHDTLLDVNNCKQTVIEVSKFDKDEMLIVVKSEQGQVAIGSYPNEAPINKVI